MGSGGSGSLSDYPGSSVQSGGGTGQGKPNGGGGSGGGGGAGGGGSGGGGTPPGGDRCSRAISVNLEDVEHGDYYQTHGTVPPVGTELRIAHRKRVVAETLDGLSVGNLPTNYNYLAGCLKEGWTYPGAVRASAAGPPIASVSADFAAVPPS